MWPPASQNARMFLAFILMCADAASRMNRANFFDFRPKCVDAGCRTQGPVPPPHAGEGYPHTHI
eukprot:2502844-Prymnesium_polylepis.2